MASPSPDFALIRARLDRIRGAADAAFQATVSENVRVAMDQPLLPMPPVRPGPAGDRLIANLKRLGYRIVPDEFRS